MTPSPGGGTAETRKCNHPDKFKYRFGTCPPESRSPADITWHTGCEICDEVHAAHAAGFAEGERGAYASAAKLDCQLCHDGEGVYHYRSAQVDDWYHIIGSKHHICKAAHIWRFAAAPAAGHAADAGEGGETKP